MTMKMSAPATRKFATERASLQLQPEQLAEPCEMVKLRAEARRTMRTCGRVAGDSKPFVQNPDAMLRSLLLTSSISLFTFLFLQSFAFGDVANAVQQDKVVGVMALRTLNGEKPQDIPRLKTANTYTILEQRSQVVGNAHDGNQYKTRFDSQRRFRC